jgi:DNA invertase Pin-like site-specific DNA recombinase
MRCYNAVMQQQIVSYVRVSTQRQGVSGLGLEAQRAAVADFAQKNGAKVVTEYREVESGRKSDRPVLAKALAHAKRIKGTLLIAKLDRLARNVHFISGLMESGVEFRCADLPEANRLLLHIMAAVAENEAKAISDRTVVALQAAKARGVALGATNPNSRNLDDAARAKGARSQREAAKAFDATVAGIVSGLRSKGNSLRQIAAALNDQGHVTRSGKPWNAVQVQRLLERA